MLNRKRISQTAAGVALFACILSLTAVQAQLVRNPRLAPADLETARSTTKELGGADAELVYAARIDAVTKGTLDSLVVVYAKGGASKEFYALVVRDNQKYRLAGEKSGRALPMGDRFLRIGLRHEGDSKPPLLRLMGGTGESGSADERQRNLDFQFDGKEFQLVSQSTASPAR